MAPRRRRRTASISRGAAASIPDLGRHLTGDATPEAFESEADDYAFAMLKRHGQSPQAFADLMRRLRLQLHAKEESGSLLQYLSTHPATEERIQRAEQQR